MRCTCINEILMDLKDTIDSYYCHLFIVVKIPVPIKSNKDCLVIHVC